ncbi:MAG: hypothetical protein R2848_08950 [Thermomicrobiales bacterium]
MTESSSSSPEVDDVGHRNQDLDTGIGMDRQIDEESPEQRVDAIEQHEIASEQTVDVDPVATSRDRAGTPEDRPIGRRGRRRLAVV